MERARLGDLVRSGNVLPEAPEDALLLAGEDVVRYRLVDVDAAGRVSPQLMMPAALGVYLVKLIVLLVGLFHSGFDAAVWYASSVSASTAKCRGTRARPKSASA